MLIYCDGYNDYDDDGVNFYDGGGGDDDEIVQILEILADCCVINLLFYCWHDFGNCYCEGFDYDYGEFDHLGSPGTMAGLNVHC